MLKRLKKVRVKKEKQENQKNKYIRFDNININTIHINIYIMSDNNSNKTTPPGDVENQVVSPENKNNEDIKDNISDISETDSKNTKNTKNWEEELEQFAPDSDSVTGIVRVRDDDTMGPTRRKYINENKLRKEICELGIVTNIEEQFYYKHKTLFERYCNDSKHINKRDLNQLLFREFDYDNNYSDEEKETVYGVLIDKYMSDYIKIISRENISFIDYFSIVKHMNCMYNENHVRLVNLAKESVNSTINNRFLRLRDETIRNKETELSIYEREKELELESRIISMDENIEIYDIRKYQASCCDSILNFGNQSIIEDFDKIYDIISKMPSLNNHDKNIILIRFKNILEYCATNYNMVSKLYTSTQVFLIMCSILNPALLSINSDPNNSHYLTIFWVVWISQILVSLITGYIGVFKWDKKYFLFNAYKTKINQEIWLFISLSGKNYKARVRDRYNHKKHLYTFLDRIENFYRQLKTMEFELENTKEDNDGESGGNGNGNIHQHARDIMQSRRDDVERDENRQRY